MFKNSRSAAGQVIDNATRSYKWVLIGNSHIETYSVAPQMWNTLFKSKNMPIMCTVFGSDDKQEVSDYLSMAVRDVHFVGANIARPWKVTAFLACNDIEPVAKSVYTVNTIVRYNESLNGYNTDGIGMVNSTLAYTKLRNKNVVLIGAGGATQTLPFHLLRSGISSLVVIDIYPDKAETLVAKYLNQFQEAGAIIKSISNHELGNALSSSDIVINATPSGSLDSQEQIPFSISLLSGLKRGCTVSEMVYNPYYTPLIDKAYKHGCTVVPGVNMLMEQAAASFMAAFDYELSVEDKTLMLETAKQALPNLRA